MKITYEDDRIIVNEEGDESFSADELVLDVVYKGQAKSTDEFLDLFDIHTDPYLVNEDMYQGLNLMRVFERKSDNRLFGYQYWEDISKYGESFVEPNGDEYGLEITWDSDGNECTDGSYFVLLPVKPITFTGYVFEE